jgi:hypothetical protein
LRAVKLEAVVSIGFSLLETTTHMLGVPPKSSGGATQSLCHVAVNEMRDAGPFKTGVAEAYRARSAGLTTAPHQHVDHDPAAARGQ